MKSYFVFYDMPEAEMNVIQAESKKEALDKFNKTFNSNYKIVSKEKSQGRERVAIVTVSDWRKYNFSKISYAITNKGR